MPLVAAGWTARSCTGFQGTEGADASRTVATTPFPFSYRGEHHWWEYVLSFLPILLVLVTAAILTAHAKPAPTYCWTHSGAQSCAVVE